MLGKVLIAPVAAALLVLVACGAFLPFPNVASLSPQGASAQTQQAPSLPEKIARGSVPGSAAAANGAAVVGDVASVVPLAAPALIPAEAVERFMTAYHDRMVQEIQAFEQRQALTGQRATPQEWIWAILAAAGAGGVAVWNRRAPRPATA